MADVDVSKPKVLTWPGIIPDTTLQVFKKTYHVHSVLLKLHTAYFRKFMDSADKTANNERAWKYEYVTVVDDDGFWALESKEKVMKPTIDAANANLEMEANAFETLLLAIYLVPYQIANLNHFIALTKLADFYQALKIVSSSLTAVLWKSPDFVKVVPKNIELVLNLAVKLRQPIIFDECFIHAVGTPGTSGSSWSEVEQLATRSLIRLKTLELREKIGDISLQILDVQNGCHGSGSTGINAQTERSVCDAVADAAFMSQPCISPWNQAEFFRLLYERIIQLDDEGGRLAPLRGAIQELLENKLRLQFAEDFQTIVGKNGRYKEKFLCTTISDEELPWDTNESDW